MQRCYLSLRQIKSEVKHHPNNDGSPICGVQQDYTRIRNVPAAAEISYPTNNE